MKTTVFTNDYFNDDQEYEITANICDYRTKSDPDAMVYCEEIMVAKNGFLIVNIGNMTSDYYNKNEATIEKVITIITGENLEKLSDIIVESYLDNNPIEEEEEAGDWRGDPLAYKE